MFVHSVDRAAAAPEHQGTGNYDIFHINFLIALIQKNALCECVRMIVVVQPCDSLIQPVCKIRCVFGMSFQRCCFVCFVVDFSSQCIPFREIPIVRISVGTRLCAYKIRKCFDFSKLFVPACLKHFTEPVAPDRITQPRIGVGRTVCHVKNAQSFGI